MLALALALGAPSADAATKVPIFDFGPVNSARGIAINESGNGGVPAGTVYVVEFNATTGNKIAVFDASGSFLRTWGWDVVNTGPGDHPEDKFEVCVPANGDVCKAGLFGGGAGQFVAIAGGLTVDQVTGNVSVVDRGNNRIQQFTATGGFLRAWGKNVDSTGGNGFEICETAANCQAGENNGTEPGTFGNLSGSVALAGIGADDDGNLYVADPANRRVQKFGPTGGFLRMAGWDVVETGPGDHPEDKFEVCVPTNGDVCKAGAVAGADTDQGRFATNQPSFLAADADGDVYTIVKVNGRIARLASDLSFIGEFAETTSTSTNPNRNAIAVNWADGHVFFGVQAPIPAGGTSNIYELNPSTGTIVGIHPGDAPYTPAADGNEWVGLAINGNTGRMYGARTTAATVIRVFEEGPPTPVIDPPTSNTGTRATLSGTVNPNGNEVDECFFEWGKTTSYGNIIDCAESSIDIGTGNSPQPVHADITGLVPNGTTYNYRLVVVNDHPTNNTGRSDNQSFATPDTVVTSAATAVTSSGATLNGTVNPDTVALTDCVFEYGTTTAYGQTAPCDPNAAGIGNGTSPVAVHADVSLLPGTPYHFRLKATYGNGIGPVLGSDLTLQTLGPRILATWSEDVAVIEARIKAQIDPEGKATTYRFEYGTTDSYGQQTPEMVVGSDSAVHTVTRFLEGLEPNTTYHFRVVATDSDAVVNEGPDHTFTTFSRLDPNTECPNQAFRIGPSAALPDCRAYEMVSPIDKNGGDIETAEQEAGEGSHYSSAYRQASIHGGEITYSSSTAFGDALGGHWSNQYLSTRDDEAGWSTHSISSRRGQTVVEPILFIHRWYSYPFFQGFTPDLSSAWIRDDNVNPLTPDALQGYVNLYRRDNGADVYEALTTQGPFGPNAFSMLSEDNNANFGGPRVLGFSADLRHQVFTASAALTPEANQAQSSEGGGVTQLYDLVDGELHLVSVLPNGQASPHNSFAGTTATAASRLVETRQQMLKNAVSDDGSRIVWSTTASSAGPGAIYIRENPGAEQSASGGCDEVGKACTRHVAGSATATDRAQFWAASADGSKVLYSLGNHPNRTLHIFDVDAGTTTIPPIAGQSLGVAATSEDLSHIYFVSTEAIVPGAIAGQNNLYDYHDGASSLVGTLSSDDVTEIGQMFGGEGARSGSIIGGAAARPIHNQTRVTPDGAHFTFMSNSTALSEASAGYDNADAVTGKPDFEVYRYDAETEELDCASCNPSGQRPRGSFLKAPYSPLELEFTGFPDIRAAASIPTHEHDNYASRILSDDGNRLFFHSDEALVLRDTNGVQDVYQWQAVGSGSCDTGDADYFAQNGGCVYLISSGRDNARSEFVDADPTGNEVFFSTDESLDPRDPGLRDIYVAKVGGGFPIPQTTAPCEGEACQSPPPPPSDPTPSSSTFQGLGDPPPGKARKPRCPKGKRKAKARNGKTRCVKRNNAKRGDRANNNRRAAR